MQLESAISGVIYEVIEREKTVSDAASDALVRYLKEVDDSYNRYSQLVMIYSMKLFIIFLFYFGRKLLTAVSAVNIDDLKRVGELYFAKILDPSLVTTAACCNPSKVKEVKEGLEK